VDVALHGADDDLADRLSPRFGEKRTKDGHAGLHGVCSQEHLGDEEDAIAKVDTDNSHAFD